MDKATINRLAGSVYIAWNEPPAPVAFHKYPMLVYLPGGSYVKVENEDEEAIARGAKSFDGENFKPVESVQTVKEVTEEPKRRGRPKKE